MAHHELMDADPVTGTVLGESRTRVLTVLQEAQRPLGVADISAQVRLHPNTTRFHLDGLVETGQVERTTEPRIQPGRPRTLYAAAPESPPVGRRSYQLLAEILTSYVAAKVPQPETAALQLGAEWGRHLADRSEDAKPSNAADATDQLMSTLADIGFDPEAVTAGAEQQVLLHHCPFREAAEEHREVVCSIHLGLMQGLLDELDAPVEARRLDPFVQPSLCVTHLAPRKAS